MACDRAKLHSVEQHRYVEVILGLSQTKSLKYGGDLKLQEDLRGACGMSVTASGFEEAAGWLKKFKTVIILMVCVIIRLCLVGNKNSGKDMIHDREGPNKRNLIVYPLKEK